ncbi:raffinose/stachyose/melibiose transport system substrate-binding protein [Nonomuraea maritima]|uniref:Raffinose/stachyose/melibiose transport system substrate-binding protein n=1 Tax=Nonomuraea maritima TaxID=683260 RepID=A0A1G9SJQ7_9ACTN|nr:extracellular solute-binding protein [Nonomuraea maritima]SDM35641.1 raffinose/stachyose/melibiose transport system substrate-binding protein [Nonomuraea maritima]
MARRVRPGRSGVALVIAMGTLTAACAPPGGDSPQPQATSAAPVSEAPTCGTAPVTMTGYFETGFPLPKELTTEFTKQHPNVTWDIREDQFAVLTQNAPRLLADNPPDLMRLPQLSELVKDNLMKNLDGYATAFGWDKWPASQLEQLRLGQGGRPRGEGSLYALGLNMSMTGVFYNKKLAEQIGMSAPPATLAEFDTLLDKAKSAGITPIVQFNGGATGGLAFPLQNLMASYGPSGPINDWIFQKPGATIDTPSNLQAVQHLERWIKAGYFQKDVNAVDYATMMSRFIDGQGLFMFNGDWESGNLDKQMAGNVGFTLMPSAQEGGKLATMSAPLTFGIAAKAKNADCAAYFLNWVATDKRAREIGVEVGGSRPLGPADAYMPEVAQDTVTAGTLAAGADIAADNGAMDFIANATGAIYAKGWTPQLQKLVAGEQTPQELLKTVQADYSGQIEGN